MILLFQLLSIPSSIFLIWILFFRHCLYTYLRKVSFLVDIDYIASHLFNYVTSVYCLKTGIARSLHTGSVWVYKIELIVKHKTYLCITIGTCSLSEDSSSSTLCQQLSRGTSCEKVTEELFKKYSFNFGKIKYFNNHLTLIRLSLFMFLWY